MRTREDDRRYARLAAKVLARGADADEADATVASPDRGANVAAIERALRARGRRRLAPWLGWGVAAAAAVALAFTGWRSLRPAERLATSDLAPTAATQLAVAAVEGEGASIETSDGAQSVARGDRIAAGASVRVPGPGHLLLALDTGTQLRVGASSHVRLTALGAAQRFDLDSGTLEADVAKVPAGGRFVVATGDAEVEVKGTRFEVTVAPAPSACAPFVRTHVVVQEGVVVVRFAGDEVRLVAGSAWPVCPTPASAVHVSRGHSHAPHAADRPPDSATSAARLGDASTLAEQNDLFAAALAARRRGDVTEAVRWLDRLIDRYPNGQLIDSARAERQRLLVTGTARAPSE